MMQAAEKVKEDKNIKRYLLWGMISAELLMSFSFLGYIHVKPISLALVYIPVLLAGCLIGVWEAAVVGLVFGLSSMWKASAFYVSAGDMMFSPLMSGKPLQSICLSLLPRVLFGLAAGLFYQAAKSSRHPLAGIAVVTSVGRLLHSVLVYGFMEILFPNSGFSVRNAFDGLFSADSLLLLALQELAVVGCWLLWHSKPAGKLKERICQVNRIEMNSSRYRKSVALTVILAFFAAVSVTLYFINRLQTVITGHGVQLPRELSYDIGHIQIQFLLGLMSLFSAILLVLVVGLKVFHYLYYYEAKIDGLTGSFSRTQFFLLGRSMLKEMEEQPGKSGYFLILDVDHFKQINDRCGHPVGDQILSRVAGILKRVFQEYGLVGRLGGDEFVVLIHQPVTVGELQKLMEQFTEELARIKADGSPVTCSIGTVPVWNDSSLEERYHSADMQLYREKRGKWTDVRKDAGNAE